MVAEADNIYATLEPAAYLSLASSRKDEPVEYQGLVNEEGSSVAGEVYSEVKQQSAERRKSTDDAAPLKQETSARRFGFGKKKISVKKKDDTKAIVDRSSGSGAEGNIKDSEEQNKDTFKKTMSEMLERKLSTPDVVPRDTGTRKSINNDVKQSHKDKPAVQAKPKVLPKVLPKPKKRALEKLSDVPADLSSLSVCDVVKCLQLLNLGQYEDEFKEQDIDGMLLSDVTKDMLEETFGMKPFEAMKLSRFVGGWRPKNEVN